MTRSRFLLGAALFTLAAARPLNAQRIQDWQYRWYWGAQGGVVSYQLPSFGRQMTGVVGGEWFITAQRVALHIAYDQSLAGAIDSFTVKGLGSKEQVSFDGIRQLQIDVLAIIGDKALQPYVGGGFVIETLTNAHSTQANGGNTTVANAVAAAASGGFLHVIGGVQYRISRKAAIYGNVGYSTQGRDFLLTGNAITFQGGLRYAFLSAKENDPTARR